MVSAAQSRCLNKLDNLAGCPVTASLYRTLNSCRGVIRCRLLVDCDKEEILDELQSQGVTDIYNILTKDDFGGRRNTNTFIVAFKVVSVPNTSESVTFKYPLKYIFQTHCTASTARNLATVKIHAMGEKFVPSVVRLDMAETHAEMR